MALFDRYALKGGSRWQLSPNNDVGRVLIPHSDGVRLHLLNLDGDLGRLQPSFKRLEYFSGNFAVRSKRQVTWQVVERRLDDIRDRAASLTKHTGKVCRKVATLAIHHPARDYHRAPAQPPQNREQRLALTGREAAGSGLLLELRKFSLAGLCRLSRILNGGSRDLTRQAFFIPLNVVPRPCSESAKRRKDDRNPEKDMTPSPEPVNRCFVSTHHLLGRTFAVSSRGERMRAGGLLHCGVRQHRIDHFLRS